MFINATPNRIAPDDVEKQSYNCLLANVRSECTKNLFCTAVWFYNIISLRAFCSLLTLVLVLLAWLKWLHKYYSLGTVQFILRKDQHAYMLFGRHETSRISKFVASIAHHRLLFQSPALLWLCRITQEAENCHTRWKLKAIYTFGFSCRSFTKKDSCRRKSTRKLQIFVYNFRVLRDLSLNNPV